MPAAFGGRPTLPFVLPTAFWTGLSLSVTSLSGDMVSYRGRMKVGRDKGCEMILLLLLLSKITVYYLHILFVVLLFPSYAGCTVNSYWKAKPQPDHEGAMTLNSIKISGNFEFSQI